MTDADSDARRPARPADPMSPLGLIRPKTLYGWKGPSLLIVNTRGDCGDDEPLAGYYFRETRFVRTLRLEINGEEPWLCEAARPGPAALAFTYTYPEIAEYGGGGSGQSGDEVPNDAHGIPQRALAIRVSYTLQLDGLTTAVTVAAEPPLVSNPMLPAGIPIQRRNHSSTVSST